MKKQDPLAIFPYGDRGAHICISANFYRHKAQASSTEQEVYAMGVDAYLYFYSLVTMDLTRKELSKVHPGRGLGGSMNSFANILAYPTADVRVVVRPIFDTFYSSGWPGDCIGSQYRRQLLPAADARHVDGMHVQFLKIGEMCGTQWN